MNNFKLKEIEKTKKLNEIINKINNEIENGSFVIKSKDKLEFDKKELSILANSLSDIFEETPRSIYDVREARALLKKINDYLNS